MPESEKDARLLLAAARAGSTEALGRVLETCRRYLLLVAERQLDPNLKAKGGASDLVQETFLEAQRDFGRFGGTSEAELLAWLRRLLLNNVGTFTRSYRETNKREVGREVPLQADGSSGDLASALAGATPSPSRMAMAREQGEALEQALAKLPDDHRQVIMLRYQEERSFEEIGLLMGRSPEAARKLWSRAMERLRREWESPP
ncbi:MAG TPA: sigma-70 family RNA polymerase sigma factor [Isosphaeraceae bacterium]|nr:sigma-70 family RNA polymerase sigma factor [Isosphaeraceae bacterium]